MARALKPQLVDVVRHPAFGTVDIYLDRNKLVFRATVAGEHLETKGHEEMARLVVEKLEAANTVTWVPVIRVRRPTHFWGQTEANRVAFGYERLYVGRLATGGHKYVDWVVYEQATETGHPADLVRDCHHFHWSAAAGEFRPPCHPPRFAQGADLDRDTVYLAYDEQTWLALETLDAMLRQLRARLDELLFVPEQAATLASRLSGIRLLGAGE